MERKTATVNLSESNARYVLLALRELNAKLEVLAHDDNIDEDERFFHANDLMETSRTYDKLEKEMVAVFGKGVLEHSHELL